MKLFSAKRKSDGHNALGETIVGCMGREIRNQNKYIEFFCPETRPYLQGARLTASVLKDQGFKVTVITDNMPAMDNKI